ncbi:MAG TPA: hypothetical protein DCY13_15635 [Verrucomicrobiales bacterium]|nr:hypothetical protein [Verrucomicrobiales bacterium]
MPVRINLLAEAIAAEEERRNDPVKRAVWIGGFCVFLVLLYYSTLLFEQMVVSSRLAEKNTEWSRLEPEAKNIATVSKNIREAADRLAALDRLATNRFLWSPVLNALQYTMVDQIELVKLSGTQTYTVITPPKEKKATTRSSARSSGKEKPASSTESIMLVLDARDYGPTADQNYNAFRDAIATSGYFKSSLQSEGGLRLAQLLPPSSDGAGAGRAFVSFTLECKFPEKVRH